MFSVRFESVPCDSVAGLRFELNARSVGPDPSDASAAIVPIAFGRSRPELDEVIHRKSLPKELAI